MNIARVSANGQITVPVEIRRSLRLKKGDKVLFFKKDNGEIVVSNTSLVALRETRNAIRASSYPDNEPVADNVQEYGDGCDNPAIYAMEMLQKAMEDEWEKAGIHSEEDVLALAAEARREYMADYKARKNEA